MLFQLLVCLQEHFRLAFIPQLREASKHLKKSTLHDGHKLQSPRSNHQHSNLFLSSTALENPQPNGLTPSTVQDAPLDLITKPRPCSSKALDKPALAAVNTFNTPINLTTGTKEHSSGLTAPSQASTSPKVASRAAQRKASRPVHRPGTHSQLLQSLVEVFRRTESDITSSKDSDDSAMDDDDEEDEDDRDSDDSLTGKVTGS